jgi:tetratricopeptide (TPR) repeat protein
MGRWADQLQEQSAFNQASVALSFELTALLDQGRPADIIDRYESNLALTKAAFGPRLTVTYAAALAAAARYQEATETLEVLLTPGNLTPNSQIYIDALNTLANLYYDAEMYDEAKYYFEKIINDSGLPFESVVGAYINLASTYRALKEYDESVEILNKVIDFAERNEFIVQELQSRLNLANTYRDADRIDDAIEGYRMVLTLSKQHDIPIGEVYAYLNYADLSIDEGEHALAGILLDSLLTLMVDVSDAELHIELYELYSYLSSSVGEDAMALKFDTYASSLRDSIATTQDLSRVVDDLYRISFVESKQEIERLRQSAETKPVPIAWYALLLCSLVASLIVYGRRIYTQRSARALDTSVAIDGDVQEAPLTEGQKAIRFITDVIISNDLYKQANLGVADISNATQMSQRRIREFIAEAGYPTIVSFVNEIRIERAKLIMQEDLGVLSQEEIAASVGFSSYRTYGRVFRSLTGDSPAAYRDLIRANRS